MYVFVFYTLGYSRNVQGWVSWCLIIKREQRRCDVVSVIAFYANGMGI